MITTNRSKKRFFPAPYDLIAKEYDDLFGEENIYYGPVTAREKEVFLKYVQPADGQKDALDIGCGTGMNTRWLVERDYNTVGIDTSIEMLRVAQEKSMGWCQQPELILCDALNMKEIETRSFDVIICLGSTLNHINNWNTLIKQVARRLRRGGRFIFSFDNNSVLEAFYWLLRTKHSAYNQLERGRIFRDRMSCLLRRIPFRNHWRMKSNDVELIVELTYESTKKCKEYLCNTGLTVECMTGVHLLSYLVPKIMDASAYLEQEPERRSNSLWRKVIKKGDNWLSKRFSILSANVIGVATRNNSRVS